jgi:hypothetical protein
MSPGPAATPPGPELYLYWRVAAADAAQAVDATRRWQRELQGQVPGLAARLLQRADGTAGDATLMEIYSLAGGVGAAVQQRIVDEGAAATAPWRRGVRHLEVFSEPA